MEYDNTQCCYVTALNEFYNFFFILYCSIPLINRSSIEADTSKWGNWRDYNRKVVQHVDGVSH